MTCAHMLLNFSCIKYIKKHKSISDVLSQKRLNVNFDLFELLTYSDYLLKSLFFDKKSKEKLKPKNCENSEKNFIFPVFNSKTSNCTFLMQKPLNVIHLEVFGLKIFEIFISIWTKTPECMLFL